MLYRKVELRVKAIQKYKAKSSIYLRAIKGWNLYVSFLTVSKEMNQSQLQPPHPNYYWGHQQINNLSSLRNLIDYRYIFTFFFKAVDQNQGWFFLCQHKVIKKLLNFVDPIGKLVATMRIKYRRNLINQFDS